MCGLHMLALDEPPRVDVLGVQPHSELIGMGDLPQVGAIGIVCLGCGTRWRDRAAFDRGEADPAGAEQD